MAKSKHRKGFKEKQQKNKAQKVSDKQLMDHRIKKYQELIFEEMMKQQLESKMTEDGILPLSKNDSDNSIMESIEPTESFDEVEVIESTKLN